MMMSRHIYAVFGVVASAAAIALASGLSAQGAVSSGWRVVFTHHYGAPSNNSLYTAVAATSTHDAWALGVDNWVNAYSGAPVAEHWNGTSWHSATLPAGLTSTVMAASATSASDVWAVTRFGGDILHFDGTTWSVARHLSGTEELTGVTAFSASNMWVFGGGGFTTGFGTWHLRGHTWTHVTGDGGGIESASALSPSDIWAIGSIKSPEDAIVHYNGTAWQHMTAPVLSGLGFQQVLAEPGDDVWATATPIGNGSQWLLLHFSNGQWTSVSLPFRTTGFGYLAPDGQGGFWLESHAGTAPWVWHRSAAGQWSRVAASPGEMALVPGTTSLFGASGVAATTGSNAAVWAFGPIGWTRGG
ncbi:MAG TPA: hypothetical protein VGS19_32935 [Streptosporangiaceae bacterium]|nr:hypothetical protein [Streptosporangiaceae bacterium]